jgi:hypothetical protein
MSIKALVWALNLPDLSDGEYRVLTRLADRHNPDFGCFPSIRKVAEDCNNKSRSSIFKHLNSLEKKGYIKRNKRCRSDGQQTSNEYILYLNKGVHNLDDGGAENGLPPVQIMDTNNHINNNHINKPILRNKNYMILRSIEIGFKEFWDAYPRSVGKPHAEKAFKKASQRVGVDKILEAVKPFSDSVSHKPKKFIPHPATWLNRDGWNDDLEDGKDDNIDYKFRNMVNDIARVQR